MLGSLCLAIHQAPFAASRVIFVINFTLVRQAPDKPTGSPSTFEMYDYISTSPVTRYFRLADHANVFGVTLHHRSANTRIHRKSRYIFSRIQLPFESNTIPFSHPLKIFFNSFISIFLIFISYNYHLFLLLIIFCGGFFIDSFFFCY